MSHPWTKCRTKRTCLKCDRLFRSTGIGNRICGTCKDQLDRQGPIGYTDPAKSYGAIWDARTRRFHGFDEHLA